MKKVAALLLLFFCLPIYAKSVQIDNLRLWAAPDHLRLVFDTSAPVAHTLFRLKNPDRLVIDIQNARFTGKLPSLGSGDPVILRLRSGQREGGDLRVVLDLKKQVKPRSFVLKPNREYGHRLVVDLYRNQEKGANKRQKVVKTIDLGEYQRPHGLLFLPDGRRALVTAEENRALLVVDAVQGVQAQTINNMYLALEHDLAIMPVINKIDLPSANLDLCTLVITESEFPQTTTGFRTCLGVMPGHCLCYA